MFIINDLAYRITAPPVGPADKPGPTNTGANSSRVNGGVAVSLTSVGTQTSTAPGQVFENLDITGYIDINHPNCVVRNCKINAGVWPNMLDSFSGPINVAYSSFGVADGLTVSNCDIIGGHTLAVRNCKFDGCNIYWQDSDPINDYGGNRFEDCFIHHGGINNVDDIHCDGIVLKSVVANTDYLHDGSLWANLYINTVFHNPHRGCSPNTGVDNFAHFEDGKDFV